jgi:TATA-box binding protein (TBP) (component of TFIID and TFIIIB)
MEQILEDQTTYRVSELKFNNYVYRGKLKRESGSQRVEVKNIDLKQLERAARTAKPKKDTVLNFQLKNPLSTVRVYPRGNVSIAIKKKEKLGASVKSFEGILSQSGFPLKVEDIDLKAVMLSGQLNQVLDIGTLCSNIPETEITSRERYRFYPKQDSRANFTFFDSDRFLGAGFENEENAESYLQKFLERLNAPVDEKTKSDAYRRKITLPLLEYYDEISRKLADDYGVKISRERRLKGKKILEAFSERKKYHGLGNDKRALAGENIYLLFREAKRAKCGKVTQGELVGITGLTPTTLRTAKENLMGTVGELYKI